MTPETRKQVRAMTKELKRHNDWGKPPAWFWPVWVLSGLIGLGFFGLVVWLVILGIQWLQVNT
mgnify:CR=1 FL=1